MLSNGQLADKRPPTHLKLYKHNFTSCIALGGFALFVGINQGLRSVEYLGSRKRGDGGGRGGQA